MSRELLQELLHAAYEVQRCHDYDGPPDVGCQIGELDWVSEIHRLREEIFA